MELARGLTQRELADMVPLISTAATVTSIEPMDEIRTEEIENAVGKIIDEPTDGWLDEPMAGSGEQTNPDAVSRESDVAHDAEAEEETPLEDKQQWIDWSHVEALATTADGEIPPTRRQRLSTLRSRYERPFPSLLRIRLRPDEPFIFAPGQYVSIRYRGTPRAYSLANSPDEDEIELCIRRVAGGRLTPSLAEELEEGDRVIVRGPSGDDLILQEPSNRDLVFLATGTGVAPFKSMIDYTLEHNRDTYEGRDRHLWLFLGAGWRDDLPYRNYFEELAREHDNFHFIPTLSRESTLSDWSGETAYVQYILMKYLKSDLPNTDLAEDLRAYLDEPPLNDIDARLNPAQMEVYACGVNAMVSSLADAARYAGVPERNIQVEGFG